MTCTCDHAPGSHLTSGPCRKCDCAGVDRRTTPATGCPVTVPGHPARPRGGRCGLPITRYRLCDFHAAERDRLLGTDPTCRMVRDRDTCWHSRNGLPCPPDPWTGDPPISHTQHAPIPLSPPF